MNKVAPWQGLIREYCISHAMVVSQYCYYPTTLFTYFHYEWILWQCLIREYVISQVVVVSQIVHPCWVPPQTFWTFILEQWASLVCLLFFNILIRGEYFCIKIFLVFTIFKLIFINLWLSCHQSSFEACHYWRNWGRKKDHWRQCCKYNSTLC